MGPVDPFHVVLLEELFAHIFSKDVACASSRNTEALSLILRIRPHEVSERPFMRYFLDSIDSLDVVYLLDSRRETAMHSKESIVDDSPDREEIEDISEHRPYLWVAVLLLAFQLEPIDSRDLASLVVASNQADALGVSQFEQEQ